ncbi:MAG TPA: phage major capsid protein [Candidatus Limnocylindrales bacterium]
MYEDLIKRERDERGREEAEVRAIYEAAKVENRDPSAEEEERADKIIASSDARKARIAKFEKLEADAKNAEELRRGLPEPTDVEPEDKPRNHTTQLIEMIRGLKEGSAMQEAVWAIPQGEELRAIADFSDKASLFVSDFLGRLIVYMRIASPVLSLASVVSGDNRPLIIPNLTADPTSYAPGEGTAITESTPTLGTVTATPVVYKALSYISWEASEDEQVGLLSAIARSQGRELGYKAGTAMSATILTGAGNAGTATGTPFFLATDLIDLFYSVPPDARAAGSWVGATGTLSKMRKFTDTYGQFLWVPGLTEGQPDRFLGRPVYEDPGLATPASATKSVLFGDFSVVFVKQGPMRVATSTDARFINDQIAIKTVYSAGAAVADAGSVKYLVSATS